MKKYIVTALSFGFGAALAFGATLTDDRPYIEREGKQIGLLQASNVIYKGSLVAISNGLAYPAKSYVGYQIAGVAIEKSDNSGANYSSTRKIVVGQGVFSMNKLGDVDYTDVGKKVYVYDDNTVSILTNGNSIVAGTLLDVDGTAAFVAAGLASRGISGTVTNSGDDTNVIVVIDGQISTLTYP